LESIGQEEVIDHSPVNRFDFKDFAFDQCNIGNEPSYLKMIVEQLLRNKHADANAIISFMNNLQHNHWKIQDKLRNL